jgi:hypothetical protein
VSVGHVAVRVLRRRRCLDVVERRPTRSHFFASPASTPTPRPGSRADRDTLHVPPSPAMFSPVPRTVTGHSSKPVRSRSHALHVRMSGSSRWAGCRWRLRAKNRCESSSWDRSPVSPVVVTGARAPTTRPPLRPTRRSDTPAPAGVAVNSAARRSRKSRTPSSSRSICPGRGDRRALGRDVLVHRMRSGPFFQMNGLAILPAITVVFRPMFPGSGNANCAYLVEEDAVIAKSGSRPR